MSTATDLSVRVGKDKTVSYKLGGRDFTSVDALRTALTDAGNRELLLVPESAQRMGTARIVLKVSNAVSGDRSEGLAAFSDAVVAMHETQDTYKAAALEKSRMFERLQIDRSDTPLPAAGEFDYVLWRESGTWYIRYKDGPRTLIGYSGLAGWTSAVQRDTKAARDVYAADGSMLVTQIANNRSLYIFAGREYTKAHDVIRAIETFYDNASQSLSPVTERIGGRAKIVISPQYEPADLLRLLSGNPNNQAAVVNRFYDLAIAKARANSLVTAKLFDSVVIERANVTDVKQENYDVVIWQASNLAGRWLYRGSRGDAEALPKLQKSDFETWTREVASLLRTNVKINSEPGAPVPESRPKAPVTNPKPKGGQGV